MKKLLLLLLFVTFLSCSSSDDSSSNNAGNDYYHPPAWIQGTWGIKSQSSGANAMYKFEKDNLCQLTSVSSLCWKEIANQYKDMNVPDIVAQDTETTSTYEAKIGTSGQNTILKFERISATQIKWVNGNNTILEKL